jgi:hypothetical protein
MFPSRIAFLSLSLLFAGAAFAAGHFEDVYATDSSDGDAMDTFAPTLPKIFVHAGLADISSGSKLTSDWIAVDTNGAAPPNYKIDSATIDAGAITNVATFSLSKPNAGWPLGKYRVDLSIDGKPAGSVKFSIEAQ